jgi:hypothetical protein
MGIAADDKFPGAIDPVLEPGTAPPARLVERSLAFGDEPLDAELLGGAAPAFFEHGLKSAAKFATLKHGKEIRKNKIQTN